jgi:hypothetical protein
MIMPLAHYHYLAEGGGELRQAISHPDMNETAAPLDDFSHAFEAAFARFQILVEEACAAEQSWAAKVAAAVRAGLRFAAVEPNATQLLTSEALARGADGIARHERLIAYLSNGLAPGRGQRPYGERLPDITEQAMASGVVMLVAQRVDQGRAAELPAIASEAIQFVLTPYLGAEEARRVGAEWAV